MDPVNRNLDLDPLRTFIAAIETGSFTAAAGVVNRSQAAVSMQIKRLEDTVGNALFMRQHRKLQLTPAGEALLSYARQLVALNDEAVHALIQPAITGQVVIGAPDNYISTLLPPVLRRFSGIYPRVSIEVVCAHSAALRPMLDDKRIDLAFMSRGPGINGDFIRMEPLVWVALEEARVWLERPLPVALYDTSSPARSRALDALTRARIKYRNAYSSSSLMGVLAVVEAGLAVAALAQCSAAPHLRRLDSRDGLPKLAPVEVVLARSTQSRRPACDALADLILRTLGTSPDVG